MQRPHPPSGEILTNLSLLVKLLKQQVGQLQEHNRWLEEETCCNVFLIEQLYKKLKDAREDNIFLGNFLNHLLSSENDNLDYVKKSNQDDWKGFSRKLLEKHKEDSSTWTPDVNNIPGSSENNAERSDPEQQSSSLDGKEKNQPLSNFIGHIPLFSGENPGSEYISATNIEDKVLNFIKKNSVLCDYFCRSADDCDYGKNCKFLHAVEFNGSVFIGNLPGVMSFMEDRKENKKRWEEN